jgi:adenine deaminase
MSVEQKQKRVEIALGRKKADKVIKNARIVNVFTNEIIPGDIAIHDSLIVGVGNYSGKEEIDACGKYVCPGLIDSHVHIESSMVTPAEFAKVVLQHGTTTVIADPHEIANVCGIEGINFMLNEAKAVPMNIFYMMPSCVPATPFENNGAALTAKVMEPFAGNPLILGLGEVMNYPAVLAGDKDILSKIELFDNGVVDGHSSGLSERELCAYKAVGVMTNHECTSIDEVIAHLRLGMYVQIREGSAARNLTDIISGLIERGVPLNRCVFCTDDKHLQDISREGHISYNIKKAVSLGVDPIEAIKMATINPAQCYRLKRLGAVAPGYSADLIVLSDLNSFDIDKVIFRGSIVCEKGKKPNIKRIVDDPNVLNTVRIPNLSMENLKIKIKGDTAAVITVVPNQLITKKERLAVSKDSENNFIPDEVFSKIVVVERHKATGNIGLGIVKGFGIRNGAIASTVAHDSHNLIIAGDNDADMLLAAKVVKEANGGYAVVSSGRVLGTLPLPVVGLMSDKDAFFVEKRLMEMIESAKNLGVPDGIDPFVTLSFLALPVIPEIRVTDRGLFDVESFSFIDI